MMVQTVTGWNEGIMVMTLLYHEEGRKLSKADGSERVLCTASPVTWSRDTISRTYKQAVSDPEYGKM
jgi:hypothetical protein